MCLQKQPSKLAKMPSIIPSPTEEKIPDKRELMKRITKEIHEKKE